jgi:hypothetical protein
MKKRFDPRGLAYVCMIVFAVAFGTAAAGQQSATATRTVEAGATWVVNATTSLSSLNIAAGGAITAPPGYSVTMTVDGVETGLTPGQYKGHIVLTVAQANVVKFNDKLTHYFRQAIFLDQSGLVSDKSVLPAAGKYALDNGVLTGVKITSVGEKFNGIYAAGGQYTIKNPVIDFTGNGGNDFAGYGSAVMSTGKGTTVILDGARIRTHGAVRTAVTADKGSNMIVKNSDIQAREGKLPDDYVDNSTLGEMKAVPWILGMRANDRATVLLGESTTATYINSEISSEGWGVLSIDVGKNTKLTAINSKVTLAGNSGYGAYSIGDALDSFYGSQITVPDYGVIIGSGGGNAIFGASTLGTTKKLNEELKLGLTESEMAALTPRQTTVNSGRFGLMLRGNATVKIQDGTIFNTGEAIFLDKDCKAAIDVDGAKGAKLNPKNGIILQIMDMDLGAQDSVEKNGLSVFADVVYREPTQPPVKAKDFDIAASHDTDVIANFSNMELKGDFYNGLAGNGYNGTNRASQSAGAATGGSAAMGLGGSSPAGRNLVLNLNQVKITGAITSSTTKHRQETISAADYLEVGEVKNTPSAAVNNGVVLSLTNSSWTVTGTSYLTSLTLDEGSTVSPAKGYKLAMSVNGVATPIKAGAYKGNIAISVGKE